MRCIGIAILAAVLATGCSGERGALAACKQKLLSQVRNPSSAHIPKPSQVQRGEGGWIFEWKMGGGLTFQNSFGAQIDSTALCSYDKQKRAVSLLIVDGRSADAAD